MVCEYCGKEIRTKSHHKGGERKFCNLECYKAARGVVPPWTAVCMYCGREFKAVSWKPNRFCSNKCSSDHRSMNAAIERKENGEVNPETLREYQEALKIVKAVRKKMKLERRCKECGRWFLNTDEGRRSYCSEACAKKADNRAHDKRLWKNGEPDLSVTLTKLYMRDGGICQICGRSIDFDCDSNSDFYPSIDHIQPISKGGLHRWDNVQLACRRCNTEKSDAWEE